MTAMPPANPRTLSAALSGEPPRTGLGLVTYCFQIAKKARTEVPDLPDFSDPLVFIQQAWQLGASAVQIPFGVPDAAEVKRIRDFALAHRIDLESTVALPKSEEGLERFAAEVKALKQLGVRIARTVAFTGRRYEQFATVPDYRAAEKAARTALRRALPIAERFGLCLALENHKDQRTEERLELLAEFETEALGVCLDVGNNIALLEDPIETVEAFAPRTVTVHFKDQGVREYEDGFLLADVPLGAGCINLRRIVKLIRAKQPRARFHLELITRDPLQVPILKEEFWRTLDAIRAPQLARQIDSLKWVGSRKPFPTVSALLPRDRVEIERRNVEQSLAYAARHLGFSA